MCHIYIYIFIIDLLHLINNQLGEMKTLVLVMGCTSVGCAPPLVVCRYLYIEI